MVYHIDVVDPTPADVVGYSPGDEWENTVNNTHFRLYAIVAGLADWRQYTMPALKEQRLSGDNPLSYLGVEPSAPFRFVRVNRNPTTRDNHLSGFNIGDEWENEFTGDVWKLVDVSNNIGTWALMGALVGPSIEIRPNVGLEVTADVAHGINIFSGLLTYTISFPSTIEINLADMAVGQLIIGATAPGHAVMNRLIQGANILIDDLTVPGQITLNHPAPNGLTNLIDGAANVIPFDPVTHGITLHGVGNMITQQDGGNPNQINVAITEGLNGELLIGRTGNYAWWHTLTAGPNVAITNHPGSITISDGVAGGDVTLNADLNTASTIAGAMNVLGGANINTSGDGVQTLTVILNDSIVQPNTNAIGTEGLFTLGVTPFVSNYGGNVFLGGAGSFLLTGTDNTMIGIDGGSALTTGSNNTSIGQTALDSVTSGSENIGIGEAAGTAITTESSNIYINNDGTAADTHTLRIGDQLSPDKSLASAYIDGIYQAPVDYSTIEVVINDANDKLGSLSLEELIDVTGGTIVKIVNGISTFVLLDDGSVWGCGSNAYGKLGLGDTVNRLLFTRMLGEGSSGVDDIVRTADSTHILKGDRIYSCGRNTDGELGVGDNVDRYIMTPCIGFGTAGVNSIECGSRHLMALRGDAIFSCGDNTYGQLGDGTYINKNQLVPAIGLGSSGVTKIEYGGYHSLMRKGNVAYSCGRNDYGQLGDGTLIGKSQYVAMIGFGTGGVLDLEGGGRHTIALIGDACYTCGRNNFGQLGDGTLVNKNQLIPTIGAGSSGVTAVFRGADSTYILKGDSGFSCGHNDYGQLGDGTLIDRSAFVAMIGEGTNGVLQLSGGQYNGGIRKTYNYFGIGRNNYGQLGNGTNIDSSILTPAVRTW